MLPVSGFFLQPECSDPGQSWPDVLGVCVCGDMGSPPTHTHVI